METTFVYAGQNWTEWDLEYLIFLLKYFPKSPVPPFWSVSWLFWVNLSGFGPVFTFILLWKSPGSWVLIKTVPKQPSQSPELVWNWKIRSSFIILSETFLFFNSSNVQQINWYFLGFDKWWVKRQKNRIILPGEFNYIARRAWLYCWKSAAGVYILSFVRLK